MGNIRDYLQANYDGADKVYYSLLEVLTDKKKKIKILQDEITWLEEDLVKAKGKLDEYTELLNELNQKENG